MAVKPEETAKPKTPVKHKTKAAIQPKNSRSTRKNDFADFPEDILSMSAWEYILCNRAILST